MHTYIHEQSMNSNVLKNRPRCYAKSYTAQDVLWPTSGLIIRYISHGMCCGCLCVARLLPEKTTHTRFILILTKVGTWGGWVRVCIPVLLPADSLDLIIQIYSRASGG